MLMFEQNSTAFIMITFVDFRGEAATVSGTPTISIYHRRASSTITDVSSQNMTQLSGSTYFYSHYINANADKTNYIAIISATYDDGTSVVGDYDFKVLAKDFYTRRGGGLIQKYIDKTAWTQEEKSKLIETIALLKKIVINIVDTNKTMIKINKDAAKITSSMTNSLNNIGDNLKEIQSQDNTGEMQSKILNISKEIESVKLAFSNAQKQSLEPQIIKEISDLKEDVDELSKIIVKIMPTEKLGEMVDEH